MLDKQNLKIIKELLNLSPDGGYKVFEIKDLSKSLGIKVETIKNDLKYLKDNQYIDIKYTDENDGCLCVLPKSRQINERSDLKKSSYINITKMIFLSGIFSGIMAFLGAFVAMLIIK